MKNKLLRILCLSVAAAVLLRALVSIQRTAVVHPEKFEIVVWGFASNGYEGENSPDIDRVASPLQPSDFSIACIWQAESEDDLCMPSEPDALFEESLLAAREQLLNFRYRYTDDDAETGGSDSNCDDNDGSVSQTAAVPTVAALWDVPDPPKPAAPARYVNNQSAPAGDKPNAAEAPIAYSYAGDGTPPPPPTAAPASPDVPNASVPIDVDAVETGFGYWEPPRGPQEDSSVARVDAIEFSRPAQVVLIGYGIGREVPAPPFGWHGREPEMLEEGRFVLMGGPTALAEAERSSATAIEPAPAGRTHESFFPAFALPVGEAGILAPVRASMTSLISAVAVFGEFQRRVRVARDDGGLHLCYRYSGRELCSFKKDGDGVWRAANRDGQPVGQAGGAAAKDAAAGRKPVAAKPIRAVYPWLRIRETRLELAPTTGSTYVCPPPERDVWNVIRASTFVIRH